MPARVAPAPRSIAAVDVGYVVVARVAVDGEASLGPAEDGLRRLAAARRTEDVNDVLLGEEGPDEGPLHTGLQTHTGLVRLHMWVAAHVTEGELPERSEDV